MCIYPYANERFFTKRLLCIACKLMLWPNFVPRLMPHVIGYKTCYNRFRMKFPVRSIIVHRILCIAFYFVIDLPDENKSNILLLRRTNLSKKNRFLGSKSWTRIISFQEDLWYIFVILSFSLHVLQLNLNECYIRFVFSSKTLPFIIEFNNRMFVFW